MLKSYSDKLIDWLIDFVIYKVFLFFVNIRVSNSF